MSGLPKGWAYVLLSDVTQALPNVKPENCPEKVFGYVDISSIDNSSFKITEVKRIKGSDAPSRARRPIQPNDVLFSNVRTYLRNIALVLPETPAQVCSTGFTVLRPNLAVDPRYIFRYVLTDAFIDQVTPQQTGTHYPATSDRVVLAEKLPLPPLNEQRRIVAKLEALLERVDACQARLAKIPVILKRFRQSVLAAAGSGRLTADWREKASEEQLALAVPANPTCVREVEEIFDAPDTWKWLPLGALCEPTRAICYGVIKLGPEDSEGVPCLRTSDVKPLYIDSTNVKKIAYDISNQYQRTILRGGEVLVRGGPG